MISITTTAGFTAQNDNLEIAFNPAAEIAIMKLDAAIAELIRHAKEQAAQGDHGYANWITDNATKLSRVRNLFIRDLTEDAQPTTEIREAVAVLDTVDRESIPWAIREWIAA